MSGENRGSMVSVVHFVRGRYLVMEEHNTHCKKKSHSELKAPQAGRLNPNFHDFIVKGIH